MTERVSTIFVVPFFFASILLGPWWLTVLTGIVVVSFCESYVPLILGGMLMDILFGAPVPVLFGLSFLYTAVFTVMALSAFFFRDKILE
jgi:hypothetical protein